MVTPLKLWSDEEYEDDISPIKDLFTQDSSIVAYSGDAYEFLCTLPSNLAQLVITSPPYNVGKEYETRVKIQEYLSKQEKIIDELVRIGAFRNTRYVKPGFVLFYSNDLRISFSTFSHSRVEETPPSSISRSLWTIFILWPSLCLRYYSTHVQDRRLERELEHGVPELMQVEFELKGILGRVRFGLCRYNRGQPVRLTFLVRYCVEDDDCVELYRMLF
jgi:hypothetical protein